jgi:hypothetical protein
MGPLSATSEPGRHAVLRRAVMAPGDLHGVEGPRYLLHGVMPAWRAARHDPRRIRARSPDVYLVAPARAGDGSGRAGSRHSATSTTNL